MNAGPYYYDVGFSTKIDKITIFSHLSDDQEEQKNTAGKATAIQDEHSYLNTF